MQLIDSKINREIEGSLFHLDSTLECFLILAKTLNYKSNSTRKYLSWVEALIVGLKKNHLLGIVNNWNTPNALISRRPFIALMKL